MFRSLDLIHLYNVIHVHPSSVVVYRISCIGQIKGNVVLSAGKLKYAECSYEKQCVLV